jgi:hypothetical protein
MRASNNRAMLLELLKTIAAGVLCIVLGPTAWAQQPQSCGDDPVAFVQALLPAIYPELQAKGGYMYLYAEGSFKRHWSMLSEYSVHVKQYPDNAAPAGIIDGPRSRPFVNVELGGAFLMCLHDHLFTFAGGGSVTGKDQWEAFNKVADTHPEWTQEQAIAELKAAGARYSGPDQEEAFLKQIPWDALTTYLGKFEVISTKFVVHQEEGEHPRHDLMWVVDLETQPSPHQRQTYSLFFEPFRGKLYHLSTMGPEPIKPADGPPASPSPK